MFNKASIGKTKTDINISIEACFFLCMGVAQMDAASLQKNHLMCRTLSGPQIPGKNVQSIGMIQKILPRPQCYILKNYRVLSTDLWLLLRLNCAIILYKNNELLKNADCLRLRILLG